MCTCIAAAELKTTFTRFFQKKRLLLNYQKAFQRAAAASFTARSIAMESTWLRPALPHALPLAFAFVSCFISGTLAIGEGIVFMLLYNISRS